MVISSNFSGEKEKKNEEFYYIKHKTIISISLYIWENEITHIPVQENTSNIQEPESK